MDKRLDQASRAIEYERAQIGHEIHDVLLPLIFAASAGVGSLLDETDDRGRQERLAKVAGWLSDAMQTGRQLLNQVYPPELASSTWWDAAAETLTRSLGEDDATVTWDIAPEAVEMSAPAALAAYRIVIEAVRNAARHGQANRVTVTARRAGNRWQIEVIDDGQGFEPAQVPSGRYGIRSMTARAELIGGTLEVQSRPGGPTKVLFAASERSDDA